MAKSTRSAKKVSHEELETLPVPAPKVKSHWYNADGKDLRNYKNKEDYWAMRAAQRNAYKKPSGKVKE